MQKLGHPPSWREAQMPARALWGFTGRDAETEALGSGHARQQRGDVQTATRSPDVTRESDLYAAASKSLTSLALDTDAERTSAGV